MKPIIFFLAFFLGFLTVIKGLVILGGYQIVDPSIVQSSAKIQSLAQFGLTQIVQEAIDANDISSDDFQISQIYSVYRQVVIGENYKFDCEFTNPKGVKIEANFLVYYNAITNEKKLVSSSYQVAAVGAVQQVDKSYTEVNATDVQYNTEILGLLTFGSNQIIQSGKINKQIPDINFTLSTINAVYRQVVSNALFYKCNVELASSQGSITIQAAFTIYYQPTANERYITDYSFQANSIQNNVNLIDNLPQQSQYQLVNLLQVAQNLAVQNLLFYGSGQVVNLAIQANLVPESQFELASIYSVYSSEQFFKFNLLLQNSGGVTITTTFTVFYDSQSNSQSLASYNYQITTTQLTTISNIIGPVASDYEPLTSAEIGNDTVIQNVIQYGVSETLKVGVAQGRIPVSDFQLSQISQAQSQVVGNGVFYKFNCNVTSSNNLTVQTIFEVYYQSEVAQMNLTSWSYNIYAFVKKNKWTTPVEPNLNNYKEVTIAEMQASTEIQSFIEFGAKEILNIGIQGATVPQSEFAVKQIYHGYSQTLQSYSFYKFVCLLQNSQGVTVNATYTVAYETSAQTSTLAAYFFYVNVISQTQISQSVIPVEGLYVQLNSTQITQSTLIPTVLQYGVQQVINIGIQQNQIPASSFSISAIQSVYQQTVIQGQFYQCYIQLTDNAGATILTNFTVFYQTSTNQTILSQYSYNIQVTTTYTNQEETVSPVEANYQPLTVKDIEGSKAIQSIINFGVQSVIQQGIQDNKVPEAQYQVIQITRALDQGVDLGIFYKFQVILQNEAGVLVQATFTIFVGYSSGENILAAYTYTVYQNTAPTTVSGYIEGAFTPVNVQEIQYDKEIASCLQYGVQEIFSEETKDYKISGIKSISRQIVQGAFYYKFSIQLTKNQTITAADFIIYYQPITQEKNVATYSFVSQTADNTTTPGSTGSHKYTKIDPNTVQSDKNLQNALEYGTKECINKLVLYNVIATSAFTVSNISSILTQNLAGGTINYRFSVQLVNQAGVSLEVSFLVQKSGDKMSLIGYSIEGSSVNQVGNTLLVDFLSTSVDRLLVGSYEQVSTSEVKSSNDVQVAIQFGVQQALAQAFANEVFTAFDFQVKEINSVYRQVVSRESYRVGMSLVNSKGEVMDLDFAVNSGPNVKREIIIASYITY